MTGACQFQSDVLRLGSPWRTSSSKSWLGCQTVNVRRTMARFYEPDLISNPDSPFVWDSSNRLVRRHYWLGMDDRTFVLMMTKGIGAHLKAEKSSRDE